METPSPPPPPPPPPPAPPSQPQPPPSPPPSQQPPPSPPPPPSQEPPPPPSQQPPPPTPPTITPSPSTTTTTTTTTPSPSTTILPPPPPPLTTTVKSEIPDSIDPKQSTPTPSPSPAPPPSALTIPSYSRWFSFASIHETERRALPEFFDGHSPARTPKTYRYFRDSIVRLCWESLSRRITFTDARRRLVGDAGTIRRVFDFLEQWGIINYVPVKLPAAAEKALAAAAAEEEKKAVEEKEKKAARSATADEEEKAVRVRKVCTSCGSVCVQAGFASDKADVFLCAKCFVRGNYRGGLTSADFKRVEIPEEEGGKIVRSDWSEKETLHLLEAVLYYGDDWKKVAEHVGNGKTQKDCVVRFVKLPFGEQLMGSLGGGQMGGDRWREIVGGDLIDGESVDESHAAKRMHLTPLADASNPIMTQVAFLSAMVGSDVFEAVAKAAVEALHSVEDTSLHYTNDVNNANVMHGEVGNENSNVAESGKSFEEAVAEARLLLEQERHDVEQSISGIIEIQMREMQEKIKRFEELELLVERERSQVQYVKNVLCADQLSLLQQKAEYASVENTQNSGPTTT